MKKQDKSLEILNINYTEYSTRLSNKFKSRKAYSPLDRSKLHSFIPGTIVDILVKEGDNIKKGDEVLVLEAMKMKNRLKSPLTGKVKKIDVEVNDKVPKGKLLIEFTPAE
ncbi:MAG: acetyl-CoA carboxylase biotin carboxyl carrier protein subunit [Bacteroidales bacterium]|nr:acetyl-CoA carboxylase biotin carboxyl carrier protein subunit [Bacteroidales bacterium]